MPYCSVYAHHAYVDPVTDPVAAQVRCAPAIQRASPTAPTRGQTRPGRARRRLAEGRERTADHSARRIPDGDVHREPLPQPSSDLPTYDGGISLAHSPGAPQSRETVEAGEAPRPRGDKISAWQIGAHQGRDIYPHLSGTRQRRGERHRNDAAGDGTGATGQAGGGDPIFSFASEQGKKWEAHGVLPSAVALSIYTIAHLPTRFQGSGARSRRPRPALSRSARPSSRFLVPCPTHERSSPL